MHGTHGTGQKGHLHVGPVLQVVVVLVEIGLDEVYQTGLLVEHGLEEVGRTDTVAAILFGIGVGYFLEFVHHDGMALFLSFFFKYIIILSPVEPHAAQQAAPKGEVGVAAYLEAEGEAGVGKGADGLGHGGRR